ncbi:MAG: thioredoxin domain-containing protein [Cyanobacteria bacterium J06623_4]
MPDDLIPMDVMPTLRDIDHSQGPLSAPLSIMTYGSYQCSQAGQAHRTTQELRESLGDQLCFVFRHYPVPADYPLAQTAAETAEAAGAQGKFWEMHNKLFANQDALDEASLVKYASELDLEMSTFLHEISHNVHTPRIQSDIDSAAQYGVEASPTFFISVRHKGNANLISLVRQILVATLAHGSAETLHTAETCDEKPA